MAGFWNQNNVAISQVVCKCTLKINQVDRPRDGSLINQSSMKPSHLGKIVELVELMGSLYWRRREPFIQLCCLIAIAERHFVRMDLG